MADMSYASIEGLLVEQEIRGNHLHCVFRCPVSGDTFESEAPLAQKSAMGQRMSRDVTNTLVRSVRSAVSSLLRDVFGAGAISRLGADLASTAAREVANKPRVGADAKREAALEAFNKVAHRFAWDGVNHRWVSARSNTGVASAFAQQLSDAPIRGIYDQGVLARMMVEIAKADGDMATEERVFLLEFIPAEVGHVDELMNLPVLDAASLGEVSEGASRETMLMLAWTVAFTDENLDAAEALRMGDFAKGLGLSAHRADELKGHAQSFVLEQALESAYAGGMRNAAKHMEAISMGRRLGLSQEAISQVDARYRKRHGLV